MICFTTPSTLFVSKSGPANGRANICGLHSSIAGSVSQSLKEAMRAKDAGRVRALRGIRAAFLIAMKEDGTNDLDDSKAIAQLRKLAKMRRESIAMFETGQRIDLADAERDELQVIETYLPSLATNEQTRTWAVEAIAKTKAKNKGDFGKVMGLVMKHHRDEVDGAKLKKIVTELLSSK